MLAARDRVDVDRLVKVTYLDPEGEDATGERRHDSAVADVAAAFLGAGMPVAAGWRWVVSWEDGQLVPDLWVRVPVPGREEGIWVPVEIEFSAKTKKRIDEEKLRSYRLAPMRLGWSFPILAITGEDAAAKLLDDLAGDLTVLTTTLKECLTGVWEGPESVWRRGGQPVGLSEIARERLAHLRQRTGRSLDYGTPSPAVWERLLGEERLWSDPWAEGINREFPPIDPQLQAGTGSALDGGKAGDCTNRPVSAPAPGLAAPARKAADARNRVPQEAPRPTPSPKPVSTPATARDKAQQRWDGLRNIHRLVAEADSTAGERLDKANITPVERLCLKRVRAIIDYGAAQQRRLDESVVEMLGQRCLRLEDQHKREVRSNVLRWMTMSRAKTEPTQAFRDLLWEYPNTRNAACRIFNGWAKTVDQAVRTARRARTLG